ncbi:MAG: hypothetical protein RL235_466 [Chlamydiota bacterium]|jgi:membrane fusion protein (multidrug efflux system)
MSTPAFPNRILGSPWKKVLLGLGCFAVCVAAFIWVRHTRHFVWTNDAFIDGYQVSISSDVEARIITLYVDEGSIVKQGDLLCQIDESIFNAQKQAAETEVALLQEQVKRQRIELEKLRDLYLVALPQYESEIISYIEFDQVEKDYRLAEAQFKVAEASLTNGIAKLGVIVEWLRHTKVLAPRDGAISKRWVVAGDVVRIGQPLFVLTDTDHVWVTANLEETKVQHLTQGDPVFIHVDAYPDRTFMGSVYVVRASAASQFSLIPPDNATGNFTKVVQRVPVKILLDHVRNKSAPYLYPGMSVEVDIKIR